MKPDMRKLVVCLSVTLFSFAMPSPRASAAAAADKNEDDPRWCTTCHRGVRFSATEFKKTVHGDLGCRDCHTGYQFNPHEPIEEPDQEALGPLANVKVGDPIALSACRECHGGVADEVMESVHGKAVFEKKTGGAWCLQCHGDPHQIRASADLTTTQRRQQMSARCGACHANRAKEEKDGAVDVNETWEMSMHGRKLHLSSQRAPGCFDCHGSHTLTDLKANGGETCAKCHGGATQPFMGAAVHVTEGPNEGEDRIAYYAKKFFAWLTFLTIFFLCVHVALDLSARLRKRAMSVPEHPKHHAPDEWVQRFDLHQRAQHGLMAFSFITLVLTGWPLSAHKFGASASLMAFFGGVDRCGMWHRVAAGMMIVSSLYHLVYLVTGALKGRINVLVMLPAPSDVKHVVENLLMFLDPRRPHPRFGRFSYFEKFDYWAVFWGVAIMVGSGLVLWFPAQVAKVLPSWIFSVVRVAHADEAILALMAIFLWHFYNVHLRPAVFPMSKVFIDGRMTLDALEEEHGAEYDALMLKREAAAATAAVPPTEEDPEGGAGTGGSTP